MAQSPHIQRGKSGEQMAARFLSDEGYTLLAKNFRTRFGEIDLIVRDGSTIVFVEVKTRSSRNYGSPAESVNQKRLERIHLAGEMFLRQNGLDSSPFRIDVIGIVLDSQGGAQDVEHFPNVTA